LTQERAEDDYSDDEIEEILGTIAPETKLVLREVRETVMESPLLALGLAFTFGILVGLGLNQTRERA
jgi:hypothetical protein